VYGSVQTRTERKALPQGNTWGIIITFKVMPGIHMHRHERPRAEGTILETVGSNPHNHNHLEKPGKEQQRSEKTGPENKGTVPEEYSGNHNHR